jgi:hypothetical protein
MRCDPSHPPFQLSTPIEVVYPLRIDGLYMNLGDTTTILMTIIYRHKRTVEI